MTIAYLRVSTGKQNPDNQKDEIRRFAEENGFTIDIWITEIVSGKKEKDKRKLGKVLKKMHKGDTMIVTEISRLSRTLTEIMTIMGECLKKGINIYTTKERYRFDDSINSKVLCFAFGLVAEIERNLISMRTKEALALRRSEGKRLGRKAGYCPKIEKLKANEQLIEDLLSKGWTHKRICRKMGVSKDTFYKFRRSQQMLVSGEQCK